MSWLLGAVLCGLPAFLWATLSGAADHPFANPVNCYFEAMSGLTTTGATILPEIGTVPRSLLLWRAMTHWLGGLGIVVLFVAVLPTLGVGGKRLFKVESTGVSGGGVMPTIRETARTLWLIYLGLTAVSVVALRLTGAMGWFEAVCHTFSMVSTGGLSTKDASIAAFDSVAVDLICIAFMLLAGVNFAVFYQAVRGRWRQALRDTELRVYLALKVIVIVLVAWNLFAHETPLTTTAGKTHSPTAAETTRFAAFQTVALHTGTGFVTADYGVWPYISQALLIGLMFIGGCSGSTAGGIKVFRFWLALKVLVAEIERAFRPNVVRPIRLGGRAVDEELKLGTLVYVLGFVSVGLLGAAVVFWAERNTPGMDFLSASSAALATIGNIGPGLHKIGPTQTYAWFTDLSKLVLSLLMALGRLELFAILVLFTPRFWSRD